MNALHRDISGGEATSTVMRMTSIRTSKPTWRELQMPNASTHNMQEETHLIDIEQRQKEKVFVEHHLVRLKYNFPAYCYGRFE